MFFRCTAILSLLVFANVACKGGQKSKLLGRWTLDSISGRHGKIIEAGTPSSEFNFYQDNIFIFKWSDFDVFGEYGGTYSYRSNETATQLTLLIHSPNKKDSIIQERVMAVLNLNDSFLTIKEREKRISFDSTISFNNRIFVYRRR